MRKWNDVNKKMPKKINKFGDSSDVLCREDGLIPFVGYYNEKEKVWKASNYGSPSINVDYWMELPKN